MSSEIILYDLPSKGNDPRAWSLNPWKARASLNFKNLPYKTEWVEYPDIAATCKKLGIPPNDPNTNPTEFSSPFAKLPDGKYIMDSRKIAEALDRLQPEPSLHTDKGDIIDRTQAAVGAAWGNLGPMGVPRVANEVLNERSAAYFRETRAKRFGMSLEELAKSEKATKAWENAEPQLRELGKILRENDGGPYVLGKEPGFADMVLGGLWAIAKKLDHGGDIFDKLMGVESVFPEHYKAVQKWFEKDD